MLFSTPFLSNEEKKTVQRFFNPPPFYLLSFLLLLLLLKRPPLTFSLSTPFSLLSAILVAPRCSRLYHSNGYNFHIRFVCLSFKLSFTVYCIHMRNNHLLSFMMDSREISILFQRIWHLGSSWFLTPRSFLSSSLFSCCIFIKCLAFSILFDESFFFCNGSFSSVL